MQTQINVKCTDQNLKLSVAPAIASGGVNENVITFEFCSLWNDFKKVAVFWREEWLEDAEKKPLPIALDENNSCVVPWEVTADAGVFFFGVLGVLGEVERTSNVLEYDVSQGVIRGEYAMPENSQGVIAQLLEKSHKHENKKTLDGFHCEAAEYVPPEDDFPIGGGAVKSDRLEYDGNQIRYVNDGDVISSVEKTDSEIKINLAPTDTGNGVIIPKDPIVIPLGGIDSESGITVVHVLPENAKDGDLCLYSPANIITLADSGKRIYFDWEEFAKPLSAREQYSVRLFSQTEVIALIDFIRTDTAHMVQCGFGNEKGTLVIRFENGVLETTYSGIYTSYDVKKTFNSIDELPRYYELPQFTKLIEDVSSTTPMCYAPYQLMVYRGGEWQNVETLFNIPLGVSKTEMEAYVTAAINGSLDEIGSMIDEIGSMIDESGVLDE